MWKLHLRTIVRIHCWVVRRQFSPAQGVGDIENLDGRSAVLRGRCEAAERLAAI